MNPAVANMSVTGVIPQTPVPLSSDPLLRPTQWGTAVSDPQGNGRTEGRHCH